MNRVSADGAPPFVWAGAWAGAPWIGRAGSARVYDDPLAAVGVIGPQAVTQLAAALGPDRAADLFAAVGLMHHLTAPPVSMVPQRDVYALHAALRAMLGEKQARCLAADAGARTAADLLKRRIPWLVQRAMRLLPVSLSARLLLAAIERHAWHFCGTANLRVVRGPPLRLEMNGCVLCRGARSAGPICDFYVGCFGALFRALVHPAAAVTERRCAAAGADGCVFDVAPRGN